MTTKLEQAQETAQRAKEQATALVPATGDAFRATLKGAFDKMIDVTVLEQHAITNKIDAADLTVLKVNLSQAIEQAINGVETALHKLDLDKLAQTAQKNLTGSRFTDVDSILDPLISPAWNLLKNAGYNMSPLGGQYSRPSFQSIPGHSYEAQSAATKLDRAIEDYGKALIEVKEIQHQISKADARTAWNNA